MSLGSSIRQTMKRRFPHAVFRVKAGKWAGGDHVTVFTDLIWEGNTPGDREHNGAVCDLLNDLVNRDRSIALFVEGLQDLEKKPEEPGHQDGLPGLK